MKSVLFGVAAMFVISIVAWGITGTMAESSGEKFTSTNNSVRLDQ